MDIIHPLFSFFHQNPHWIRTRGMDNPGFLYESLNHDHTGMIYEKHPSLAAVEKAIMEKIVKLPMSMISAPSFTPLNDLYSVITVFLTKMRNRPALNTKRGAGNIIIVTEFNQGLLSEVTPMSFPYMEISDRFVYTDIFTPVGRSMRVFLDNSPEHEEQPVIIGYVGPNGHGDSGIVAHHLTDGIDLYYQAATTGYLNKWSDYFETIDPSVVFEIEQITF